MSDLEQSLLFYLKANKLPTPEREWRFLPDRKFRFDMAYTEGRVGVEVEGGTWVAGRHNRGGGFAKDCEKYNLAALNGWVVIRVTSEHIENGQAVGWIRDALELRGVAA